jgi:hypothetical protein
VGKILFTLLEIIGLLRRSLSLKIKSYSKALSTMLIVAVVAVIVIVIAGVAAYGYMAQNPADPATTLTPTSTPTAEPQQRCRCFRS